jgi:hypothetical protein
VRLFDLTIDYSQALAVPHKFRRTAGTRKDIPRTLPRTTVR